MKKIINLITMLLLLAFLVGSFIGCAKQPYIEQEVILVEKNASYMELTKNTEGQWEFRVADDKNYQPNTYYVKTTIWKDKETHDYFYCNQTGYLPADSVLFYKALECDKARVILDNLTKFNSEGGCE